MSTSISNPELASSSDRSPPSRSQTGSRKLSTKKWLYQKSAAAFRWVHIYVSMLSFTALMFFAFTGITLNHPTWLGGSEQAVNDIQEKLPKELATNLVSGDVDKLELAEWMRAQHGLKGKVTEFDVDDFECMIVFKGPGYSADVFVDRERGSYMLTTTQSSVVAILNDLHKGRDSGLGWSYLIDISAVVMMAMSLSGFGLLLYLKKRRRAGVLTAVAGTIAMLIVWVIFVP